MISISRCSSDCRPNMHQWGVKPCNVSLTMIRRHPQWEKNRYKVNFPLQVLAGCGIRISLPLQGFLGVFTSRTDRLWAPWISGTNIKGEAKPSRISYHLVSLSGSGRALTSLLNGDYLDTQSQLTVALWLIHIFILLNVMQCSCKWAFPLVWQVWEWEDWWSVMTTNEWMLPPPPSANGT